MQTSLEYKESGDPRDGRKENRTEGLRADPWGRNKRSKVKASLIWDYFILIKIIDFANFRKSQPVLSFAVFQTILLNLPVSPRVFSAFSRLSSLECNCKDIQFSGLMGS